MNQQFVPPSKTAKVSNKGPVEAPDLIAMVGFHNRAVILSKFVATTDHAFEDAIAMLPKAIQHSTNLTAGLRTSIDMLLQVPHGIQRRIWALSDGQDNLEVSGLMREVERAAANRININTIAFGFGDDASPQRLRDVSAGTHNGKFVSVKSALRLGKVLRGGVTPASRIHRAEATVFCIDLSPSMNDHMGHQSKIEVVRKTMIDLIHYKRVMWS